MQRRDFLKSTLAASAASMSLASCNSIQKTTRPSQSWQSGRSSWPICLDTATLSGKISLEEKVELAAAAGFDAIEPWDRELKAHEESGKSLKDLNRKIKDLGLFVPSVIGVWGSLAPDKQTFENERDQHRERLRMISDVGASHAQIIPKFDRTESLNHYNAAWAYAEVCKMAKDYHLDPGIIFLNFVPGLEKLADAVHIALLSGVEKSQVIPDTFHMFLTGESPVGLERLNPEMITIFQFADAAKSLKPSNAKGLDKHRVLPGDGQIDLVSYLKPLKDINYKGCISLELYNPEYRKREPKAFLAEAIEKTRAVLEKV
ncbi:sugar phosphate isomerase/epimerase [Lentisphaera marina]|uniref:sugar phosphate isomerase/epimerase family protein n=1 Tax=Lentisphaera marina TaxID=1111041 RepID=UPI0023661918|nr:sugar phosphate isomerase/epimerase [Lentisphaera marina]MDD7986056.1 sugar phosphate isomerase/epimerase [Lentisphaera marina]